MRNVLLVLFFSVLFYACKSSSAKDLSKEELLQKGYWELMHSEEPLKTSQSGYIFSENNRVVYFDSQGHSVPASHSIKYEIRGDTLQIVDYKYTPEVLFQKGTSILFIQKLDEEELILKTIYPDSTNVLLYRRR